MEKLIEYCDSKPRGFKGQLADKIGIPSTFLSQILSGKKRITIEMAEKISAATDGELTLADLLPDLAVKFAPRSEQ